MKKDSGNVTSKDKLVIFLYELMKDHLVSGKIEEIMIGIENCEEEEYEFTNEWLAKYAQNITKRLQEK